MRITPVARVVTVLAGLLAVAPLPSFASSGGVASPNQGNPGTVDILQNQSDRYWSYDIGSDWWTVYALPAPTGVGSAVGGHFNDCDYILLGGGTSTFVKAGSICGGVRSLASAPFVPGAGAALAAAPGLGGAPDDFVFALRGAGTGEFWRYSISGNSWTRMADLPVPVADGGGLAEAYSPGGPTTFTVAALAGAGSSSLWFYNLDADAWSSVPMPFVLGPGSAMTAATGTALQILAGDSPQFWNYSLSSQTWTRLPDAPATPQLGSGITKTDYGNDADLYAVPGGDSSDVWVYHREYFMPIEQPGQWLLLASLPLDNHPPIANAGPDQTLSGCADCVVSVTLDASATVDPDGHPMRYSWREGTRPLGFTRPTPTLQTTVSGLGPHVITLTATDSRGGVSTDAVVVTVVDPSAALQQQVRDLQAALSDALAQVSQAQQQLTAAQADLAACRADEAQLSGSMRAVISSIQSSLGVTFGNPRFTIAGASPQEQLNVLAQAIASMNRGGQRQLYEALGGHAGETHPKRKDDDRRR